ncbi:MULTISPECIES: CinA family protein [unclassified Xanthobacter]|uniref:CinA family protein n=1 Tax=unclassified Xanthobacter TaxID=2623496 RepID=UPI001EDCF72C|nr:MULTISPECIES: nicotinamide-nucleotide amidohydrolase family protein [unclassified Xanthobacter]
MPKTVLLETGATLFPAPLLEASARVLAAAKQKGIRLAAAETVTSGLVSATLTSVSGASEVFERGFVLYHASAKATGLGVPEAVSAAHGAVSAEVTRGLVLGVLEHSQAGAAVAITGYAGPGGGNAINPVGTIFVAAATRGGAVHEQRHVFAGNRDQVRLEAVRAALAVLEAALA